MENHRKILSGEITEKLRELGTTFGNPPDAMDLGEMLPTHVMKGNNKYFLRISKINGMTESGVWKIEYSNYQLVDGVLYYNMDKSEIEARGKMLVWLKTYKFII